MNYYERWCGDYMRDTAHLSLVEHGAYTVLLDTYYSTERPLPSDLPSLFRICRAMSKPEQDAVKRVADQFFPLGDDGLRHNRRADEEIPAAQSRIETARANGRKGGRKPKPKGTQKEPNGLAKQNPSHPIPEPSGQTPQHHTPLKEQYPTTTTSVPTHAEKPSSSPPVLERAEAIARMLMSRETARGKKGAFHGRDERILRWAEAGIKDPVIKEAYEQAVTQRIDKADEAPINTGFLDVFIGKMVNPQGSVVQLVVPPPPATCVCCGSTATTKKIGRDWYCQEHDQFSEKLKEEA